MVAAVAIDSLSHRAPSTFQCSTGCVQNQPVRAINDSRSFCCWTRRVQFAHIERYTRSREQKTALTNLAFYVTVLSRSFRRALLHMEITFQPWFLFTCTNTEVCAVCKDFIEKEERPRGPASFIFCGRICPKCMTESKCGEHCSICNSMKVSC